MSEIQKTSQGYEERLRYDAPLYRFMNFTVGVPTTLVNSLLTIPFLRKMFLNFVKNLIQSMLYKNEGYPRGVQEDKYYLIKNVINYMDQAISEAKTYSQKKRILTLFSNLFIKRVQRAKMFRQQYGFLPPGFLTISPGKFCNLKCIGCYATSDSVAKEKLDWDVFDRIITEKTEKWGSCFTVISGGEPFLYESQGKNLLDICEKHKDNLFLVFTNGTLFTKEVAQRMAKLGNVMPAISIEGYEKETDCRRGPGVHKKILESMKNLRAAGIPFGISVTATRQNAEVAATEELYDYYFKGQGAGFCWIFQYMPIGREQTIDLMVTPEQRLKLYRSTQRLIREKGLFIADFWNCGAITNGCISAGRPGGYLYIEWNGNVTPCVFNPYAFANVYDVYKEGKTLSDLLEHPFLVDIRKWQDKYALEKKPEEMGNWILPCAIKDHYEDMRPLLEKHKVWGIDEPAQIAKTDENYKNALIDMGKKVANLMDPIWEKEYLADAKERAQQKKSI